MIKKTTNISVGIALDEERMPEQITWSSDDNPTGQKENIAKAMLLAFFDGENKETLKIDLWTKEMQIIEMDRFFFQTLRSMADTYFKATQNTRLASDMQRFVQYFGEQTEIIPKNEEK